MTNCQYTKNWSERIKILKTYPEWDVLQSILPLENQDKVPDSKIEHGMLDAVWNQMNMSEHVRDEARLLNYYKHPVWILAGLYSECNPASVLNRYYHSSAVSFVPSSPIDIFESGGGFGALARMICDRFSDRVATYDIIEPFVNSMSLELSKPYSALRYLEVATKGKTYDLLFSTEVIEHVIDPLGYLLFIDGLIKPGGYLYITADFYPTISCHLRYNFHWRYCWQTVVLEMGYEKIYSTGDGQGFFRKRGKTFDRELLEQIVERSRKLSRSFAVAEVLQKKHKNLMVSRKRVLSWII